MLESKKFISKIVLSLVLMLGIMVTTPVATQAAQVSFNGASGTYYGIVSSNKTSWVGYNYVTSDARSNTFVVKVAQAATSSAGYGTGGIDGLYGSKTYNAVFALQRASGLSADGTVGTNTWSRLYNIRGSITGVKLWGI